MAILDDCRSALRITSTSFDNEISDLIDAAKQDMIESGVDSTTAADYTNALVQRATVTYVKANFGWNNPDADRLAASYQMQLQKLALAERGADDVIS